METTLPGMRREGKGCQRKNLEAACACVRACVCVCELCGSDSDQTSWGSSKQVGRGTCQSLRSQCVWRQRCRAWWVMLGNTAVQLFVSVLRLVLRLGGLRTIHQTFAEVPSSLRELWGIHKWEFFMPALREFTIKSFIQLIFIPELLFACLFSRYQE